MNTRKPSIDVLGVIVAVVVGVTLAALWAVTVTILKAVAMLVKAPSSSRSKWYAITGK